MPIHPKNLDMVLLLDFYGSLLTKRQQEAMTLYYEEDLSLSEMSESLGSTRQAAHELLRRSAEKLIEWETHLHLLARYRKVDDFLSELESNIDIQPNKIIKAQISAFAAEWRDGTDGI